MKEVRVDFTQFGHFVGAIIIALAVFTALLHVALWLTADSVDRRFRLFVSVLNTAGDAILIAAIVFFLHIPATIIVQGVYVGIGCAAIYLFCALLYRLFLK